MVLNLSLPPKIDELTCDWEGIDARRDAVAALRGTITILNFELLGDDLDLDRIYRLAGSVQRGSTRVRELTDD
jgi:hypothetical protein